MTADPTRTLAAVGAIQATRARRRPASPAELARRLIPGYVVTPTIRLISDELERAATEPDSRLILTTPPRTGKSVLVSQVFPVWLLSRFPDCEIIVKSYGNSLAEEHSSAARRMIAENAALLGIELAPDKRRRVVGAWPVTEAACWQAASFPALPVSARTPWCWTTP